MIDFRVYVRPPKSYQSSYTDGVLGIEPVEMALKSDDVKEIELNAIPAVAQEISGISKDKRTDLELSEWFQEKLDGEKEIHVATISVNAHNEVEDINVIVSEAKLGKEQE